jgi:hypothetical protein
MAPEFEKKKKKGTETKLKQNCKIKNIRVCNYYIHIPRTRSRRVQEYLLNLDNMVYFQTHNAFELPAMIKVRLNAFFVIAYKFQFSKNI